MDKLAILFMTEDDDLCRQVNSLLLYRGVKIKEAGNCSDIIEYSKNAVSGLLILEASGRNGKQAVEIAKQIKTENSLFSVILVTAQGSETLAVAALRAGVDDYFTFPIPEAEFIAAIGRCFSGYQPPPADHQAPSVSAHATDAYQFIGESAPICKLKSYLHKVAAVDSHVLITGETGTGKELTAQAIHLHSARRAKPFMAINCAALPDGLLESELFGYEKGAFTGAQSSYAGKLKLADGGTVFFDEIGDMSPYAQAKLLRVIESKEVCPLGGKRSIPIDIRIVAATNRDLEERVAQKEFRQDLYYRLNVARIRLPPLRDRKEDIPSLVDYYLYAFNARFGLNIQGVTDDVRQLLLGHDWPGNIRELKNLLEAIYIDPPQDWIDIGDLPDSIYRPQQTEPYAPLNERELLLSTLSSVNWNKSKAAQQLQWSRMTLYRKMTKHCIVEEAEEPLLRWPHHRLKKCNPIE